MDQPSSGLTGIFPVLPTPFTAEGAADGAALQRLVTFALDAGVAGLVFPGFASEVAELTDVERRELLGIVVEEAHGRVPVIAGASAESVDAVVAIARHASALGLEYIMVQSPVSIGNDLPPVLSFFNQIASAIPEMKIILQNAPAPRGADLSPATISSICANVPQVAYIKEETLPAGPAISYLVKNGPGTLRGVIGGGGARYILDEYERGACAAMPALEIADLHVKLDLAWRQGRKSEARELYVRTLPLLALQAVYRMRLTKHVLMRRGLLQAIGVRAPTPTLDAIAIADIDNNLAELGLIDNQVQPQAGAR